MGCTNSIEFQSLNYSTTSPTTTTDYTIDANGDEYAQALPFVLVMIVIYPLGIPSE